MASALPFDDFRTLIARLPGPNARAAEADSEAQGRLGWIASWLAAWSGRGRARVGRPLVALFAGTHGVAARIPGLTAQGTARTVERIGAGRAAVNHVCAAYDLGLKVFDLALDLPTGDITAGPALDERGCAATMAFGMEAIAGGADLVVLAGLGAGGAVSAAALMGALTGEGAGRFLSGAGATLADEAIAFHGAGLSDPLEALRRVGGREGAAIAGAILAARMERVPVILDGPAALAAAVVLHAVEPEAVQHCLLAAPPSEPGHAAAAERMRLGTLLAPGTASPAGVDGAVAAGIVRAAAAAAEAG